MSGDSPLGAFLARRDLPEPDGRPLYAYHATAEELAAIEEVLKRTFQESQAHMVEGDAAWAGAFCLWAAEWWRRNHSGGPWKWEGILTPLGAEELRPGSAGYGSLTRIVERGLTYWRVELLQTAVGRGFLITLACQGGLPLQLVKEGQGAGRIRRFFRSLLQEMALPGSEMVDPRRLARRVADTLPRSLRQEVVFELGGRLAWEIRSLQDTIEAHAQDSGDPVETLDRLHPRWRERLPLRLDDEVAKALLRNLLSEASDIARRRTERFRWNRSLHRSGGNWTLEALGEVPRRLDWSRVRELFGIDPAISVHQFQLVVRFEDGRMEPLAMGRRRYRSEARDEPAFDLEPIGLAKAPLVGPECASGASLLLRAPQVSPAPLAVDMEGGSSLSDLPWVFSGTDPSQEGELRVEFRGEGSLSIQDESAIVLVTSGTRLIPDADSSATRAGSVDSLARELWVTHGTVRILSPDGEETLVQTGTEDAVPPPEYVLAGREEGLDGAGTPLWRSLDLVRVDHRGMRDRVPSEQLEWKPSIPGASWAEWSSSAFGDGLVRVREGGRVRAVRRIRLLPPDASILVTPDPRDEQAGGVRFSGFGRFGEFRVTLEEDDGVDSSLDYTSNGDCSLEVRSTTPREELSIRVDWEGGQRLAMQLPFPGRWFTVLDSAGEIIADGDRLVLWRLSGIRARAFLTAVNAKPRIHAQYIGTDHSVGGRGYELMLKVPRTKHSMDLFERDLSIVGLDEWAQVRLDAATDPDAHIRISMMDEGDPGVPGRRLSLGRFDLVLEIDEEGGLVRARRFSGQPPRAREAGSLQAVAWSLHTGDLEDLRLLPTGDRAIEWLLPETLKLSTEEYMILVREGQLYRAKPVVWRPGASAGGPSDLDDLYRSLLRAATGDPFDGLWNRVDAQLRRVGDLPASSFPLLRRLAEEPDALAMAALVSSELRGGQVWHGIEELGILWQGLPVRAWGRAVGRLAKATAVGSLPPEALEGAIEQVIEHLPPMRLVMDRARARALTGPLDSAHSPGWQPPMYDEEAPWKKAVTQAKPRARRLVAGGLSWCPTPSGLPRLLDRVLRESQQGGALHGLLVTNYPADDPKSLIMNAPVLLAAAAAFDLPAVGTDSLTFRVVRQRDPEWFDSTWDAAMKAILTVLWRRDTR